MSRFSSNHQSEIDYLISNAKSLVISGQHQLWIFEQNVNNTRAQEYAKKNNDPIPRTRYAWYAGDALTEKEIRARMV